MSTRLEPRTDGPPFIGQAEFARIFCERPASFAWFLGAGASHNANLPTAEDIITDLKRRYYCSEEGQKLSTKDLQNDAVRARVEAYMLSRGFPERWSASEYTTYFETIFGDDRERQRHYIAGMLAAATVTIAGPIAFVGLIAPHAARLVIGARHQPLVPIAAGVGIVMVLGADLAGQLLPFSGGRVPVGIFTALIGGPAFIWLLRQRPLYS